MKFFTEDSFFEKRWGCKWYPAYDKLGHAICYHEAVLITGIFIPAWKAFIIWESVGILYEFIWETLCGRKPSWRDLVANFIGGGTAWIYLKIL